LKRYSATGLLGDPNRAQQGQYLDVSELGDYQAMQEKVLIARNAFMELPAEERRAYNDDPALWIEAMQAAQVAQVESSAQAEPSAQETDPAGTPANQGE
jgi:hypothetical protein